MVVNYAQLSIKIPNDVGKLIVKRMMRKKQKTKIPNENLLTTNGLTVK